MRRSRPTRVKITMGDPTILNILTLTTPLQTLLFNNASPRPVLGFNAQFYQPSTDFLLNIDNRFIQTTSYVVQYDAAASVQEFYQGALINGPSFTRDFGRLDRSGEEGIATTFSDDGSSEPWYFPVEAFDRHLAAMGAHWTRKTSVGPAVNLGAAGLDGFTVVFTRASH